MQIRLIWGWETVPPKSAHLLRMSEVRPPLWKIQLTPIWPKPKELLRAPEKDVVSSSIRCYFLCASKRQGVLKIQRFHTLFTWLILYLVQGYYLRWCMRRMLKGWVWDACIFDLFKAKGCFSIFRSSPKLKFFWCLLKGGWKILGTSLRRKFSDLTCYFGSLTFYIFRCLHRFNGNFNF